MTVCRVDVLTTFHCVTRKHGSQFEKHALAFEEGAGQDDRIVADPLSIDPSGRRATKDIEEGEEVSVENEKNTASEEKMEKV